MTLKIIKLNGVNAVSIQQDEEARHFISSSNSFVIGIPTLTTIINFLVQNNFMHYQILEGILEERHTNG